MDNEHGILDAMANTTICDIVANTSQEETTTGAKGKKPCQTFPLMKLPVDIRLIVYECVLGSRSEIVELYQTQHYRHQRVNLDASLSRHNWDLRLLRTCQ